MNNTQYFRITAYSKDLDISGIFDCHGMFERLWQFSSFIVNKGFEVIEVSNGDKFLDGNMPKVEHDPDKIILRAQQNGRPNIESLGHDGTTYIVVKIADKIYVPDKERRV